MLFQRHGTDLLLFHRIVEIYQVGAKVRVTTYLCRGSLVAFLCDETPFIFFMAFWPTYGKRRLAVGLISTGDYAWPVHEREEAPPVSC